jgi:probable H4MPT-linked C1 transfer pathway protein
MPRSILGLDVGGANLKAAHADGTALSYAFALWKQPAALPAALAELIKAMPRADLLAVTMTGELCDCFATKREGVAAILDAVEQAAAGTPVRVWSTDGCFVDPPTARRAPLKVAAANWMALATYAGKFAPFGSAALIDIGTTTTDIVPLLDGLPVPRGRTDLERLQASELVYLGWRRTPVCAILGLEVAAEYFATAHDAYLVLGDVEEDAGDCDTADGRPATRVYAEARLARMLCGDKETTTPEQRLSLARKVNATLVATLASACDNVGRRQPGQPRNFVISGSGEFLAREVLKSRGHAQLGNIISLAEKLGSKISTAACAYALTQIVAKEPRTK